MAKGDPSAGAGMGFFTKPVRMREITAQLASILGVYPIGPWIVEAIWGKGPDPFSAAVLILASMVAHTLVELAWLWRGSIRWKSRSRRVLGWGWSVNMTGFVRIAVIAACVLVAGANFAASGVQPGSMPWWAPTAAALTVIVLYVVRAFPRERRNYDAWKEERRVWLESIGKA
jgi:hypothetical protein